MGAEAGGEPVDRAAGTGRPGDLGGQLVSPALVGRDDELRHLVAAVSAPPSVIVVEGEAGVGKTRLAEELLARPELSGSRRLTGQCRQIREPFPLGAVIEAVRGVGEDLRGLALDPVAGALRPLVPELARWLPAALEPLDDRQAERHRVFRGLVEMLLALASTRPLVLVLEDIHWADAQTLEFAGYLLSSPRPQVTVVLTYRSEDANEEVAALTARLPRLVRYEHVRLEPLDVAGTRALAAGILGVETMSGEFAGYLWERTGGLPLAVEEVLALVRARGLLVHQDGGWARRALDELDVPRGIRDPTLHRVAGLPEPTRRVVEAAAVLQMHSPLPVLLAAAGLVDGPGVTAALEQAIGSGLLAEQGELIGFRHVLAGEAVYESLRGPRRRELHGRAAAALRQLRVVPLGQLAYQLRHAGLLAEWAAVAEEAADQAMALGHVEEAARLLEDVVRNAPAEPEQRAGLAIKLGWAALDTLHVRDVIDLLSEVLEQPASRQQRAELQFQVAMAMGEVGEDSGRQRGLIAAAAAGLGGRPDLHAWALLSMGIVSPVDVPIGEDITWVHRALEALDGVDDPLVRVFVLGKAASVLIEVGDPAWHDISDQVLGITGGIPRQGREANAFYSIGLSACYAGHLPGAERLLQQGLQAPAVQENRRIEMLLRSGLALFQLFAGTWTGLREEVAVLLGELEEYELGRVDVELATGCLALARGELGEAGERFEIATQLARKLAAEEVLPIAVGSALRVGSARGTPGAALGYLDLLLESLDAKGFWPCACWALPSAVEAWMAAGNSAQARQFLDRAQAALGDLDAPLAPAALAHGRGILGGSARDLVAAADLYQAVPVPYEAARSGERAAGLMLSAGDPDAAEDQLRRALTVYERLGASWDHARAVRLARQHGLPLARRHGGGRRSYGKALSPQEQAVAELALAGSTNKQIGAELFISHRTVDKHMSSIMRKMGARSRAELPYLLGTNRADGDEQR